MSFMYRTDTKLGMSLAGRIVPADDAEAVAQLPEGALIPIDDAERLGLTTEKAERQKANHGHPASHVFKKGGQ